MQSTSQSNPAAGIRPAREQLIALRAQARRLDLVPRGRVLATRSGGHLSRFRGRGMEFDESRVYQPGDDPRNMDWRVTARAGTPHVKLFREERERPVWLLVDQGPTMRFGSRVAFKSVIAAQVAALLGWAAVDRGDRVGALAFDEAHQFERRPAARGAALLPLLDWLSREHGESSGGHPGLIQAAERLAPLVRPGSLVAIVSDFADLQSEQGGWLTRLAAGSEVLLVMVYDPLEAEAPPPGRYPVLAGARRAILDLTGRADRDAYRLYFQRCLATLDRLARREGAHLLQIATQDAVGPVLALGLRGRAGAAR